MPDGDGSAAGAARSLPGGNVPTAAVAGNTVTLSWTASTFSGGAGIPGYVVRRFNSVTQLEATVLSGCAGLITTTSCVEGGVAIGTWRYTVTPAAGAWRGAESAQSAVVTVLV